MAEKKFELGYAIVDGGDPQELAMRCQSLLAQGFRPKGGIAVNGTVGLIGPAGVRYYQAMFFKREIIEAEEAPPTLHSV